MKSRPRRGAAILSPAPAGWRARFSTGGEMQTLEVESLGEAGAAVPAGMPIHLELPCDAVLLERLTLPATDPAELEAMARLQLEKTLPFPAEDVTSTIEIIGPEESGSSVLAAAAGNAQLEALCAPLRAQGRLPVKLGLFARAVASGCGEDHVVPVLYKEEGRCVIAVCERGRLGFAQTLEAQDTAGLERELRQTLLGAAMAGVPATFHRVRLEAACSEWREMIGALFGVPVEMFAFDPAQPESPWDLLPPAWQQERRRLRTRARWKGRLILAGALWLLLLVAALGYLGWLSYRAKALAERTAAMQPELDLALAQQDRWKAIAPAVEPDRFAVEVLFQVFQGLPSKDVRITNFTFKPAEFVVEGEAPSGASAVEFADQLKKNPQLATYKIDLGPPQLLPNDHAQFRIFGKRL